MKGKSTPTFSIPQYHHRNTVARQAAREIPATRLQRKKRSHARPKDVNREAELKPPSRFGCGDLLGRSVITPDSAALLVDVVAVFHPWLKNRADSFQAGFGGGCGVDALEGQSR